MVTEKPSMRERLVQNFRQSLEFRIFLEKFGILIGFVVLIVVATIIQPRFLTPTNLLNVIRQVSIFGILAIGQTFVILTAGIDLSVGSILALVVVIVAGILSEYGIIVALLAGLGDR